MQVPSRRGVVGAEELELGPQAGRGLERQRDQVGLRVVALAEAAVRVGAAGVEVAQRRPAQAVGPLDVRQHALDHRLGGAVGVDRARWRVLGDRLRLGVAVDRGAWTRARRRARRGAPRCSIRLPGRATLFAVVAQRVRHRLGHRERGREVEHAVEGPVVARRASASALRDRPTSQRTSGAPSTNASAAGRAQVVDHDRGVPGAPQRAQRVAADVAGAAGHEQMSQPSSRSGPVGVIRCPDAAAGGIVTAHGDRPHRGVRVARRRDARGLHRRGASPTSSCPAPAAAASTAGCAATRPTPSCDEACAPNRGAIRRSSSTSRASASDFDLPLDLRGTAFQLAVYATLARDPLRRDRAPTPRSPRPSGARSAVRAVGAANGANPLSLVVPCHRVVAAGGKLGGYGGGLALKKRLLAMEHAQPAAGRSPLGTRGRVDVRLLGLPGLNVQDVRCLRRSRACSRSAIRSSASSMPQEKRTSESVMP